MKLPYFEFWVADAETDANYRSMTLDQTGLFHRLLNLSWSNDGLDFSPKTISQMIGITEEKFNELWAGAVSRCFYMDGSCIRNAKQEEIRGKAIGKITARSRGGKASSEKRWHSSVVAEQPLSDSSVTVEQPLRAYDSDSVSDSSCVLPEKENKSFTRALAIVPAAVSEEPFRELIGIFLSLGVAMSEEDTRKCAMLWVSLEIPDRIAALIYAREKVRGEWARCEERYVTRPWNYLSDKHWRRRSVVKGRDSPATKSEISTDKAKAMFRREMGVT